MKISKYLVGGVVVAAISVGGPAMAQAESEVLVPAPSVGCGDPDGGPGSADGAECPVVIDGTITVNNRTRKDRARQVRVIIRNANGKRVARVDITVEVAARSSVSLDPTQFLDLATATDGKHTYVVRNLDDDGKLTRIINARGSFDVAVAMA